MTAAQARRAALERFGDISRAHGEMELELRVDFLIDGRTPQAERKSLSDIHYAGRSTFDTALAKRAHASVLVESRRRPAAVIR